jgi:hypothetical protein
MRRLASLTLLLLTGCFGDNTLKLLTSPPPSEVVNLTDAAGTSIDAAGTRLRHLTPQQYQDTVRELLQLPDAKVDLPDDAQGVASMLLVEKLDLAAEALVATKAHHVQVPCAVASGTEDCAFAFIEKFGARAFRRPLSDEERAWLRGVFTGARASFTFQESIDVTTRVILQSPQLFYLQEEGREVAGLPAGVRSLTGYERASRLSYFLWGTMPDAPLFEAAAKGELDSSEGVRAQARRMLADPRAKLGFRRFVLQWLELDGTALHSSIEQVKRDPATYPLDSAALRMGMRRETEALTDRVMARTRSLRELLTSREAYVNGPLAKLYGAPSTAGADTYEWVTLDPAQRSGLFTRGAFLLLNSNPGIESPIRRGAHLVKRAFCSELGQPPPDVSDVPITGGSENVGGAVVRRSLRESVTRATSGGSCSGCHSVINPAGFGLNSYDGVGQFQTLESGTDPDGTRYSLPIDSTGDFVRADVHGQFSGGAALSEKLAASRELRDCVASRWFRQAFDRPIDTREKASLAYAQERFAEADDLRELVIAIVESPAFLYLRAEGAQP